MSDNLDVPNDSFSPLLCGDNSCNNNGKSHYSPAVEHLKNVVHNMKEVLGEAVGTGAFHITSGLSEAVHSVSSGVGSTVTEVAGPVGDAVCSLSGKMVRCMVLPPHLTSSLNCEHNVVPSVSSSCDEKDGVETPRTPSIDSGVSSSLHNASADPVKYTADMSCPSSETDSDSLLEETIGIYRELGLDRVVFNDDKNVVCEKLTEAEVRVLELIHDTAAVTTRRRALVHTLVAVREHKQKLNELVDMAVSVKGFSIKGHLLTPENGWRSACDVCTRTIWDMFSTAYVCSGCGLLVHSNCASLVRRLCPAAYFSVPSHDCYSTSSCNEILNVENTLSTEYINDGSPAYHAVASRIRSASEYLEQPTKRPENDISSDSPISSKVSSKEDVKLVGCETSPKITSTEKKRCNSEPKTLIGVGLSSPSGQIANRQVSLKKQRWESSPFATVITKICPERGLGAQSFCCAECKQPITNRENLHCLGLERRHGKKESAWSEPRLCHYSGLYFCPACHWNDVHELPALIVSNWQFEARPVSRSSYQLLHYIRRKPLFNINVLNPQLFIFLQELCEIKKMREDLILMKEYLASCRIAVGSRLLHRLSTRQHFVDNSIVYSLQDLLDVKAGVLLPELRGVHEEYSRHIMSDCEVCKGRGHICLNCKQTQVAASSASSPESSHQLELDIRRPDDVLYPFEQRAVQCRACHAVMHAECYILLRTCARCVLQGRPGDAGIVGEVGEFRAHVSVGASASTDKCEIETEREITSAS